jgi:hypothetical protein
MLADLQKRAAKVGGLADRIGTARRRYISELDRAVAHVFKKFPLSQKMKRELRTLGSLAQFVGPDHTGLVFAGFGTRDTCPQLIEHRAHGIVGDRLVAHHSGSLAQLNLRNASACIVPFAQKEMVRTFMEGISPLYRRTIEQCMARVLKRYTGAVLDKAGMSKKARTVVEQKISQSGMHERALTAYSKELVLFSRDEVWHPIVDVVGLLPKHELATMAQALVALQSLKRRISFDADTVGEPIDVAIISKGDGFIWVKRKHYFEPQLNQAFLANYLRR